MNIKEQFNLSKKVAIITGSSKGIGKAIKMAVTKDNSWDSIPSTKGSL